MIEGVNPIVQGFLGTLFTWFVTAVGSAVVFLIPADLSEENEGKLLDFALGFAGGVMLAASFWSLLDPALELAATRWTETWSFFPVAIGFLAGAIFVYLSDVFLPDADTTLTQSEKPKSIKDDNSKSVVQGSNKRDQDKLRRRNSSPHSKRASKTVREESPKRKSKQSQNALSPTSYRRILLLLIAVVLHNFPEGLAVGVAFGGIGFSPSQTFEKATAIAYGIGLQNMPEGLAVSLPLRRLGWSRRKAFFYGQLSGMVEPLGGILGAGAVSLAQPILPYALAFAAGAMVYVVLDSVSPESHTRGNGALASWGAMAGFIVMMSLDVALG